MIRKFKNIMFYADGARGELAALKRAHAMACHYEASLTVVGLTPNVSSDDPKLKSSINELQLSLTREKGLKLDKLISQMSAFKGLKPSVQKLVIPGDDYVALLDTIRAEGFDLLIKGAETHTAMRTALFGNEDLRLLHYCPCPVMIVKPNRRRKVRNVLAAVDPSAGNVETAELNREILETAISVSEVEVADLHLLHVMEKPLEGVKVRGQSEAEAMKALALQLKEDATRKLERIVENYIHVPIEEHLLSGKPEKTIPDFVNSRDMDLLVMGSVARSGVRGFVVGNTAEKILDNLDCSVMVLKPPHFEEQLKAG